MTPNVAVPNRLLAYSYSTNPGEALEEWHFTGDTVDHEKPIASCELCDQTDLRYHFRIYNDQTGNELWVGSHCILKFDVPVYDDAGNRLSAKRAESKLNSLIEKMQLAYCIRALESLAVAEKNEILATALRYYRARGYLTPKQANVVLWRLKKNGIDHKPTFFKVRLTKGKYRDDLASMPDFHVHTIWPALSPKQREFAIECGHTPPPR